jgi:5-methylcytosine-specific restriction endonuclease McrA
MIFLYRVPVVSWHTITIAIVCANWVVICSRARRFLTDLFSSCLPVGTPVCKNIRMKKTYDWATIQRYCDEGHFASDCLSHFGTSRLGLRKAVTRGDLHVVSEFFDDRRLKHDWAAIRFSYESGKSMRECAKQFGFCIEAWSKAVRRGDILPRPNVTPLEELLASPRSSSRRIKARLLNAGILKNECGVCGLCEWREGRIRLLLDRINGVRNDSRLENLRLLCSNCKSQTAKLRSRGPDAPCCMT